MIVFPNSKINIGLNILRKRDDGFHEIETIMYPINLKDSLEVITNHGAGVNRNEFINSGIEINSTEKDNLVIKAYNLLCRDFNLPPISIHLHKAIPFGAGLGGGSSDASYMLKVLNSEFSLNLSDDELRGYSSRLGSDCPFFIDNTAAISTGRGEILKEISLSLKGKYLLLIVPDVMVGTAEAYSNVIPRVPEYRLQEIIKLPVKSWKDKIKNDFEDSIFLKYPEIMKMKTLLYNMSAEYASMSGSGSSVFGIFNKKPDVPAQFRNYFVYKEYL